MDKRKAVGRNVEELQKFFWVLPEARFCLDVGHARHRPDDLNHGLPDRQRRTLPALPDAEAGEMRAGFRIRRARSGLL